MSTQKKIDELKLLYYQTTPGAWGVSDHLIVADDPNGKCPDIYIAEAVIMDSDGRHDVERSYSNMKFLVEARNTLPSLLSVAESAVRALEEFKKTTRDWSTPESRLALENLESALSALGGEEPVQANTQNQMTAG